MIGKTNSLSGSDIKGETLKVSLRTNQSSHSDLNGVAFTFEYADLSERYVWEGSDIIIKIPPYLSYTITPEDVDGYKTPSVYSSTSIGGFQKTATLEYQCTIVTVKSDDNQPDYNDVSASTATVSASGMTTKTIPNGGTAKVPTGNACTITWGAISGYKTPDSQTFTASGTSVTKTGTYQTEILTVIVNGIPSNKSYQITISGIGSQNTSSEKYKIPFGTSYTVSASDVSGYNTPSSQSFTANSVSRSITMEYLKGITDLSMQDIFGNSISRTTANSYVIKEEGEYKLPLVFGNAIKNGTVNSSAFTKVNGTYSHDFVDYKDAIISSPYIESVSGSASSVELSMCDTDSVFSDFSIINDSPCRFVKFKVNSIPSTGANGVISIKDSSGIVMWSWHIWVWADDLTPVEITNKTGVKYNILPVNLATKKSTTAGKMYNWFYQWGRPTPMLPPSDYNSKTNATNYGTKTFTVSSAKANTYGESIQNPQMLYTNSSSNNWFGTASYYNLWDSNCVSAGASDNNVVKTVYDPCPVGFKMPNGNTFTYFSKTNIVGKFNNGFYFRRYANDNIGAFFPASGHRGYSNGSLNYVGTDGYVWLSSSLNQGTAYLLNFYNGYVQPKGSLNRAQSFSVRPVQE